MFRWRREVLIAMAEEQIVEPLAPLTDQVAVGQRLKELRLNRGLSLQKVADTTKISKSFLALVESGASDVSFGRLRKLLWAYDSSFSDLVAGLESGSGEVVVRYADVRHLLAMAPGLDSYLASPSAERDLLAAITVFGPRGAMTETSQHDGDEVFHVLEGTLELFLDGSDESVTLQIGDTAYVTSRRLHRLANPTDGETRFFSVAYQRRPGRVSAQARHSIYP
jgi:transcriptional regulator with XRE-family HTH domain